MGRVSLRDSLITGRRCLRDEPPYRTLNYGTEGLTGRRRLRDEPLTGLFYYGDGGASGTSLLRNSLITGRRRLRNEPPDGTRNYGAEGLTGRDGGVYGTSLLTGLVTGRVPYGTLN